MHLFKAVLILATAVVLCQATKSDLDLAETSGILEENYNYDYYDTPAKSTPSAQKAPKADILVSTKESKPKIDDYYDYDDYQEYDNKDDKDDKVYKPEIMDTHEFINQPTTPTPEPPVVTHAPKQQSGEASTTRRSARDKLLTIISKPGILAGIVGGAIIGVLTAILLIMFIVYRMKKKDEGSYALEETKKPLNAYDYRNCPTKEFYA